VGFEDLVVHGQLGCNWLISKYIKPCCFYFGCIRLKDASLDVYLGRRVVILKMWCETVDNGCPLRRSF
jgi:hypothetical protein